MQIYNTLSGKKERLAKPWFRPLRLFVCGPTVYGDPHIGNGRTLVFFDIFVRYLRSQGYRVFFLENITDIDDKIINRAEEERTDWKTVAEKYEKVFLENMTSLGVRTDVYARATDYIPQIVTQVQTLVRKKHAYLIENDGYYFDLSTFPDYGKLAHRTVAQAEDGVSRIDASDKKRNAGDFCVWKCSSREQNEPGWETALGFGRPGWHIEDTAITEHFFGPQYDIHGGGADLKFPHHEAEIAQQESASGKKPFVKLWMHVGFLTVEGQKMSKSLRNFITINETLKKHSPQTFRMAILMHHYRSPFDYSETLMTSAEGHIESFSMFLAKLILITNQSSTGDSTFSKEIIEKWNAGNKAFLEAMNDDMNTPEAMARLFEFLNILHPRLWDLDIVGAKQIYNGLSKIFETLGFALSRPTISKEITELARKREEHRASQQFMQADALRNDIETLGYIVEDTPLGPFLWPKRKRI